MKIPSFKKAVISLLAGLFFFSSMPLAQADTELDEVTCAVYLTGIGCSHCAKVDPILFEEKLEENPNFILIEYEIFQEPANADLMVTYSEEYDTGLGVPLILFDEGEFISGDTPILEGFDEKVESIGSSCPLPDGPQEFSDIKFSTLPKSPKIWTKNRIIIPASSNADNLVAKELLLAENVTDVLPDYTYSEVDPKRIDYSNGYVKFDHAVKVGGWLVQWNGEESLPGNGSQEDTSDPIQGDDTGTKLTLTKLISLAIVDAINPCALAVLALMLIGIMTYNPGNRRKILAAGMAFLLAVFVMYLVYGLVIIKLIQIVQVITSIRLILYKALGVLAIILGLLNIKDFIRYRPGTVGTEMPMFMRPRMKKIVAQITGPRGAFIIGLFVTLFLLPCTIGPYVIAGGILSTYELMKTIPPLLLYNFIFVLPMVVVIGIVYAGASKIEHVRDWKDDNIRYLHLAAGIIMLLLGIAMFLNWV